MIQGASPKGETPDFYVMKCFPRRVWNDGKVFTLALWHSEMELGKVVAHMIDRRYHLPAWRWRYEIGIAGMKILYLF